METAIPAIPAERLIRAWRRNERRTDVDEHALQADVYPWGDHELAEQGVVAGGWSALRRRRS